MPLKKSAKKKYRQKNVLTKKMIQTMVKQLQGAAVVPGSAYVESYNPITKDNLSKERAIEILNAVVNGLNQGGPWSSQLWNILSALRGPDTGSVALKQITTGRVRASIGLRPGDGGLYTVFKRPLNLTERQIRSEELHKDETQSHFREHYEKAVCAIHNLLDYDLYVENPVEKIPG